jgi:predicted RND superfamily exporter protein
MLSSVAWCAGLMPWLVSEVPSQRQIGELLLLLVLGNLLALLVLLPAIAGFGLNSVEAVSADAAGEDGQRS